MNFPVELTENLEIIKITPANESANIALGLKQIVIEFNKDIDPASVTQDSIEILSYPVSGSFDGPVGTRSDAQYKVFKIVSVESNKIILEL